MALLGMAFFGLRIDLAYCLGYTLASTGTPIVLPCLAKAIHMGYGIKHKVPHTVFASCAFDDISSIIA